MLAPPGATVAVVVFPAPASDVLVSLPPMLAPPGATVVVVVLFVVVVAPVFTAGLPVVVFPAPASDVLVSLPPMLAPPGATVVVVVLFVVVVAPVFTAGLPVVVVFCDKQSDCMSAVVVVTFVPLAVGPSDVPLDASVAAVSLPPAPVACSGLVGATDIDVSTSKTAGKAIVAMNLPEILGFIAVFFLSGLLLLLLISL